jgi:long-chain acyl-CoA synthetase
VRNAFLGPLTLVAGAQNPGTLLFLPLAHVFARIIQVGCLEGGIVLGHCGDLTALLPALASFRPTFILAVPRVFEKVYNTAEQKAVSEKKGAIFSRAADAAIAYSRALDGPGRPSFGLRAQHAVFDRLVYRQAAGGARRPDGVRRLGRGGAQRAAQPLLRGIGVTVLEGYGLTETTAATTVNRPDRNKIGTVGQPLPGVAIKIADDGEILISGKNVFPGYWRNEAATKEVFAEGGWFATGDIGELDEEGFLKITGRKKEMIVTAGGKNVAPAVLEDRLRSHALISQCMVVGDGKPFVAALITLDPEASDRGSRRTASRPTPPSPPCATTRISSLTCRLPWTTPTRRCPGRSPSEVPDPRRRLHPGGRAAHRQARIRRSVLLKDFAADIDALYS